MINSAHRISNELENAQAAFVKPMLGALDTLWQAADANSSNREVLKSVFESFRLSCRVFYSLNALGLTEVKTIFYGAFLITGLAFGVECCEPLGEHIDHLISFYAIQSLSHGFMVELFGVQWR